MFDVLAQQPPRFCDGISRRAALRVGALGTLGLGLPGLLARRAQAAAAHGSTFGKAKRMLLLFMWGGPAHQDTWDLKPDGPSATRGEFLPIETTVPGMHISEHFPRLARQAQRLAIIRSVGQDDNNHSTGAHAGLTGRRHELKAENFGARASDFPHFGSVLSKLRPNRGGMPTFVAMPEVIGTTAGAITPGQGGGLLGKKYDPFRVDGHPDRDDFSISSLVLCEGMSAPRLAGRRSLLEQVEQVARVADRSAEARAMGAFYRQALDMVLSSEARQAFDLTLVSPAERERYGWHTFGQSVLLARRLLEAGVQLVTVYWHREDRTIDTTWDTHALNFQELKNRLMPSVDRPIAALLDDLAETGLLDETLVVWNSEFGRTPKINKNAGRDHWGPCNSVVMAGGGVPGGQVFGASDENSAYPTRDKVTQDDIAATIYHLLGVAPETYVHDRLNRPLPVALGRPIGDLLGERARPEPTPAPKPRVPAIEVGPLTRLLRERCGRFLALDLGVADSEAEWELDGWGEPSGTGGTRHRPLGKEPARLKYLGHFHPHFNYSHLLLRLAAPAAADKLRVLLDGAELSVPEDWLAAAPRAVWQLPFPSGAIRSTKTLQLQITAPNWQVASIGLLGDPLSERWLKRVL